jgi:anaerobic dimethyl sulfoxide reductase subunit B
MQKQLGFSFDSSSCAGCKTCQLACRDKHDLSKDMLWRRVTEVSGGEWRKEGKAWVPDVYSYFVSISCNHCENPMCLQSCPIDAIVKDDNGIVTINEELCLGCRYCEMTCPYGALHYDSHRGVMSKCDMCSDYIMIGKAPACVSACPMRALGCGELKNMAAEGDKPVMYPLPDPGFTLPYLVITPHPDSLKAAMDNTKKGQEVSNDE